MTTEIVDIAIIGGGPVGLFTAFYAGLRQASVKIIESLPQLGGQPGMLYPEKMVYDIPAYPEILAGDLVENLIKQLDRFEATQICLEEEALQIEKYEDYYEITTSKQKHFARTIIIACGNGAFRPRKLELEGAENYENHQLHYFVTNLEQFRDKNIAICGGGDSAVDWALALENIAKKLASFIVVHNSGHTNIALNYFNILPLKSLHHSFQNVLNGDGNTLQSVTFKQARGEEEIEFRSG